MIINYLLACLLGIVAGREAIIEGDVASGDQFHYQVSVRAHGQEHGCGGCIISKQFVLTAAHCVLLSDGYFNPGPFYVLAGTNHLNHTNPPAMQVEVARIYVPREFAPWDLAATGDIAVLRLKQPLELSKYRNAARLKLPGNKREFYDVATATVSGFGWNRIKMENGIEQAGSSDGKLRFARADVIAPGHPSYPPGKTHKNHICAKVQQNSRLARGVCTGDSGGPLVHADTVIGILSRSQMGCSEIHHAATYTRVSNYLTFIAYARMDKVAESMRAFPQ